LGTDVTEHFEELLISLLSHACSAVLDLRLENYVVGQLGRLDQVHTDANASILFVEFASIGKDIIQNLLVESLIHEDTPRLELGQQFRILRSHRLGDR